MCRIKKKNPAPKKQHVRSVFILNCWMKLCKPMCNQAWSGCLCCQGCHPHLPGLCLHQLFPPALHLALSLLLLDVAALPPEAPPGSPGLRLSAPHNTSCCRQPLLLLLRSPKPAHARDPDGPRRWNKPGALVAGLICSLGNGCF